MKKRTINDFRNGDIKSLTFADTVELKRVIDEGATTFTSDRVAAWLFARGEKFKDFGFKYEIKAVTL